MDRLAVIDASPLIILSRANRLHLLKNFADKIIVPDAVAGEILHRGENDLTAKAIKSLNWLEICNTPEIPEQISNWGLGIGESSVLAVAYANPNITAIIDDLLGRKCAACLGLTCRGTLGLVLMAKKNNYIPSARNVMNEMIDAGLYLSPSVLNAALSRVGE